MPVVECYSGASYPQRPLALEWGGRRHEVSQVEKAWREPEGPCYQVRTREGLRFQLQYKEFSGVWKVTPMEG